MVNLDFWKLLSLIGLSGGIVLTLSPTIKAESYQTRCYQKQKRELIFLADCAVEMDFDRSDQALHWYFRIADREVQHYRNTGQMIEVWNQNQDRWVTVNQVDWFSVEKGILCWDDFCANWHHIPLD